MIPSGILGDRMGPRTVLLWIVLAWSALTALTALTGAAWSLVSLWLIRFLIGAGEAVCFPNLTRTLAAQAAGLAMLPLVFGGFGSLCSGYLAARVPRDRWSPAVALQHHP